MLGFEELTLVNGVVVKVSTRITWDKLHKITSQSSTIGFQHYDTDQMYIQNTAMVFCPN